MRRAETLSPTPEGASSRASAAWSDMRIRTRAASDRPLAWALVMAPVLVAVVSGGLLVQVSRTTAGLLERASIAGRMRAADTHVRRQIERIRAGADPEPAALREDARDLGETIDQLARTWDGGRAASVERDEAFESELRQVRQKWTVVSGALGVFASETSGDDERLAARVTLESLGVDFSRDIDRLGQDVERHSRWEQQDHERRIEWLLAVLVASLFAGAVFKHLDLRRLRHDQLELERLSLVAESTGSSVVIADAHGRGLWANDAFLRTTGWESVQKRTLWELVGAEPGSFAYDVLQRATFRRESQTGEYELRRRDGRSFWAAVELMPVRDGDGAGTDLMFMFSDITARVNAAREQFASEARFRSALAVLSEGFLLFGPDGTIVQSNAAALRVLGVSDASAALPSADAGTLRYVHEDGTPMPLEDSPPIQTLRTGRGARGVVVGVDRPSGERTWLSVDTAPFVLPGEGGHGVVVTFTDITARRKAEQSLRVLTRVVEESPTMVMITDPWRKIEYVNPAMERATGFTLAELRGRTPEVMLSDLTPQSTWDSLHEALAQGLPWRGEIHNVARDGTPWLSDSQSFPLHDGRGGISHHVALMRDVTELRRREAELAGAREAALAAARAKSEFLQNVSHELRTPLNGIMGMAELLLSTPLEPGQRGDLLQLRRSAEELLDVVTHLFEYATSESPDAGVNVFAFRLRDVLTEVEAALASEAEAAGLRWRLDVAPDVPDAVRGAASRLRRVLLSLASNAVKFTEEGEVELRVRRAGGDETQVRLHFAMRDTGIGIAPERQTEIFEAFSQVDGSHTRRYGGIGLGLALASRLVQQMGGRMEVASTPGVGSTFGFEIALPLALESELAPPSAERRPLGNARVLVLTAQAPGRAALRSALERAGADARVMSAGDDVAGELARAVREGRPHRAVVIDTRDGGFDGFAAFARLASAGAARPPVVLFSAAQQPGEADRCRALGIAGYLSPPSRETDLVEALRFLMPAPAPNEAPKPMLTPQTLRAERARRRVLLVDDNAVNRRVASRLLERWGYEVGVAVDGRDAVEQFAGAAWDALLMDVQMPEMDGIEATRRIRELEAERGLARTPVLALTAHTLDADRLAVLEAGMDDLVPKPILPDDLMATLQRHLPDAPVAADPTAAPPPLAEVLDWNAAVAKLDGDEDLFAQLLHIFEADAGDLRRNLESAGASGEPARIERTAHALRTAAATISARRVRDLAGEIEGLAQDRRVDDAIARLDTLWRELSQLVDALGARREQEAA